MSGRWLARVARRLLDAETFELMVAPAIADLQFESRTGAWPARCRAYAAVVTTCAGAVAHDIAVDLRVLHEDAPTLATVVLMQIAYYSSMLLLPFAGTSPRELVAAVLNGSGPAVAATLAVVVALSTIPTLVCFWPARRIPDRVRNIDLD